MYEAATDSCMGTAGDTHIFIRNKPEDAFQPALLIKEKEKWKIYRADKMPLDKQVEAKNNQIIYDNTQISWGDEVCFIERKKGKASIVNQEYVSPYEEKTGYAFIGEPFGETELKKYVFIEKNNKKNTWDRVNADELKKSLDLIIEEYRKPPVNKNLGSGHSGYKGYKKDGPVIPIWYKERSGRIYVSPAAIGRTVFSATAMDLAGKPCDDRKSLCPACSLFGMVSSKPEGGYGSKVRITDAVCSKDKGTTWQALKELGTPEASYLLFYSDSGKYYDEEDASIRGRKFYWHIPTAASDPSVYSAQKNAEGTEEKTKRNSTMELLKPESEFQFRIYFDGINNTQMQELKWLVTLGENRRDSNLCFKFGHGKPLGLGSGKVVIEEIMERKFEDESYQCDHINAAEEKNYSPTERIKSSVGYEDILQILNFRAVEDKKVCYPYINAEKTRAESENDIAAHQWFSQNKDTLPGIEDVTEHGALLHAYRYISSSDIARK